jgi:hypothetical protein
MIVAVVQIVLCSLAGYGVFRLWKRIAASGPKVFWLVTAGLLIRAVAGVVAFWMSYLAVPVARSFQLGRGLWLFAIDALTYVQFATHYAHQGPLAILTMDRSLPSPFFIQMLAGAMLCFGSVISVAILLNVAVYLGSCAVVLSFGDAARRPVVFAIAVLSLSPSAILWSLQPLKDISFLFLVMAFFGAARVWQQLWKNEPDRRRTVQGIFWSAVMAVLLYGISGVRWYFGAVILIAAVPFVLMTIIGARGRRTAAVIAVSLLPLFLGAFLASASPYIPSSIRSAFRAHDMKKEAAMPKMVLNTMHETRRGFDQSGGATIIGAGSAILKIDTALAEPAPAMPVRTVSKRSTEHRIAAVRKKRTIPHPIQAAEPAPPVAVAPAVIPAPSTPRPVQLAPPRPKAALQPAPLQVLPVSPLARILAGTAAIVLPHSIGQRLGIVDVRGGRGLWLFVEVDTIIFDIVIVFVVFSVAMAVRRRAMNAPVFWLALLVTGGIGLALVYTVSNFGTLFRHRDMLLAGLVLLPLALAASGAKPANDATA